jgi:hypothetical protein
MPREQHGLRTANTAGPQRALQRKGPCLLVQRCGAASQAAEGAAETEAAFDAGGFAHRMPHGSSRALTENGDIVAVIISLEMSKLQNLLRPQRQSNAFEPPLPAC